MVLLQQDDEPWEIEQILTVVDTERGIEQTLTPQSNEENDHARENSYEQFKQAENQLNVQVTNDGSKAGNEVLAKGVEDKDIRRAEFASLTNQHPMKVSEIAHRNTADEAEVEVHERKGWFRMQSTQRLNMHPSKACETEDSSLVKQVKDKSKGRTRSPKKVRGKGILFPMLKVSEIARGNTADDGEIEVDERKGWFRIRRNRKKKLLLETDCSDSECNDDDSRRGDALAHEFEQTSTSFNRGECHGDDPEILEGQDSHDDVQSNKILEQRPADLEDLMILLQSQTREIDRILAADMNGDIDSDQQPAELENILDVLVSHVEEMEEELSAKVGNDKEKQQKLMPSIEPMQEQQQTNVNPSSVLLTANAQKPSEYASDSSISKARPCSTINKKMGYEVMQNEESGKFSNSNNSRPTNHGTYDVDTRTVTGAHINLCDSPSDSRDDCHRLSKINSNHNGKQESQKNENMRETHDAGNPVVTFGFSDIKVPEIELSLPPDDLIELRFSPDNLDDLIESKPSLDKPSLVGNSVKRNLSVDDMKTVSPQEIFRDRIADQRQGEDNKPTSSEEGLPTESTIPKKKGISSSSQLISKYLTKHSTEKVSDQGEESEYTRYGGSSLRSSFEGFPECSSPVYSVTESLREEMFQEVSMNSMLEEGSYDGSYEFSHHDMCAAVVDLYAQIDRAACLYMELSQTACWARDINSNTYDTDLLDLSGTIFSDITSKQSTDDMERVAREVMSKMLQNRDDLIQSLAQEVERLRENQKIEEAKRLRAQRKAKKIKRLLDKQKTTGVNKTVKTAKSKKKQADGANGSSTAKESLSVGKTRRQKNKVTKKAERRVYPGRGGGPKRALQGSF